MLHRPAYRDETWVAYGEHTPHAGDTIAPTATTFDYNRYNDDQRTWGPYYEATVGLVADISSLWQSIDFLSSIVVRPTIRSGRYAAIH